MRVPIPLVLAAVLIPGAALAQPARKPGWWEMTVSMSAPVAMKQTMQACADPASDKGGAAFSNGASARGDCTQGPATPAPGGGWRFSSTCKTGGMTLATTGTAKGDFNRGYRVESVTRMSPAPLPQMAETRTTIDARWVGPCPAGRKPGDMVVGGRVISSARK